MNPEIPLLIEPSVPSAAHVRPLLDALSAQPGMRFGSDRRTSIADWQAGDERYIFLVVRRAGEAVGCGAVWPIGEGVGEVKRMFAKYARRGIGEFLLQLEANAQQAGYQELWLETRVANTEACRCLYQERLPQRANYGQYAGKNHSSCLGKRLNN